MRKAIQKIQRKRIAPKWLLPGMRRFLENLDQEIRQGLRRKTFFQDNPGTACRDL